MKKGPPAIAPLQGDLFGSRPAAASTPLTPPERESNAPPSDRAAPSTIAPAVLPPPTPSREANEHVSGGEAPHAMPSALAALAAPLPPAPMVDSRTEHARPPLLQPEGRRGLHRGEDLGVSGEPAQVPAPRRPRGDRRRQRRRVRAPGPLQPDHPAH